MQKLCKLGPWSKGAISTLLVCNDVLICAVPKSNCLLPHVQFFSSVYSTAPKITHCMPGAVNSVHDDKDISIRKYIWWRGGNAHKFSPTISSKTRELVHSLQGELEFSITPSNVTRKVAFIFGERLWEGHVAGK